MLESAHNPAELALPYAEQLVTKGYFDTFSVSQEEEKIIVSLEHEAEVCDMLNKNIPRSLAALTCTPGEL